MSELFVYIVESPSPRDQFEKTAEGALIERALRIGDIPAVARTVADDEQFLRALHAEFASEIKKQQGRVPVLHVSAHGNDSGFALSNGSTYGWETFAASLRSLNRAMDGALLLCMSSCKGYSVSSLARQVEGNEQPYAAVVGSDGEPTWAETLLGYQVFYHQLAIGRSLNDACEAMKIATGHYAFRANTPSGIQADDVVMMTRLLNAMLSPDRIAKPPVTK